MKKFRTILVAIKDPSARSLPAVVKAGQIAKASKAKVELLHVISDPIYEVTGTVTRVTDVDQALRARFSRRLDTLAARLRRRGVLVTTHVESDYPAYEAIIRRGSRIKADLIVAEQHPAPHSAPWLLKFTDWELIRLSPVPVLLVKHRGTYRKPRILAALDPEHSFSKPAALDAQILGSASGLARALGGTVHAMHAYEAVPVGIPPEALLDARTLETLQVEAERRAERAMARTLRSTKVPRSNRHVVYGLAADAIPKLAARISSQIVVMGAISRSGLKALLIGNTAERVIDALKADILVVKPKQFQSPVRRTPRGVRIVAPPYPLAPF